LDHYPDDQYYYHVSEDANVHAVGYTVEAEQGFLPFPDQSVDLLIIGHALELYQNHQSLFIEVERVLSPNGRIFMATLANYWLGTLPKHYHPLGDLRVAPQSMRKIKRWLEAADLAIVAEHSLISDQTVMMSERLKETIIRPIGLEIQRFVPQWADMAGAVK
jgi:ubiquinone/menaquinone biosynthesis C-methylase UbiE